MSSGLFRPTTIPPHMSPTLSTTGPSRSAHVRFSASCTSHVPEMGSDITAVWIQYQPSLGLSRFTNVRHSTCHLSKNGSYKIHGYAVNPKSSGRGNVDASLSKSCNNYSLGALSIWIHATDPPRFEGGQLALQPRYRQPDRFHLSYKWYCFECNDINGLPCIGVIREDPESLGMKLRQGINRI